MGDVIKICVGIGIGIASMLFIIQIFPIFILIILALLIAPALTSEAMEDNECKTGQEKK